MGSSDDSLIDEQRSPVLNGRSRKAILDKDGHRPHLQSRVALPCSYGQGFSQRESKQRLRRDIELLSLGHDLDSSGCSAANASTDRRALAASGNQSNQSSDARSRSHTRRGLLTPSFGHFLILGGVHQLVRQYLQGKLLEKMISKTFALATIGVNDGRDLEIELNDREVQMLSLVGSTGSTLSVVDLLWP